MASTMSSISFLVMYPSLSKSYSLNAPAREMWRCSGPRHVPSPDGNLLHPLTTPQSHPKAQG